MVLGHTGTHASETLIPPLGGGSWPCVAEDICNDSVDSCGGDPKSKNMERVSSVEFEGLTAPILPEEAFILVTVALINDT